MGRLIPAGTGFDEYRDTYVISPKPDGQARYWPASPSLLGKSSRKSRAVRAEAKEKTAPCLTACPRLIIIRRLWANSQLGKLTCQRSINWCDTDAVLHRPRRKVPRSSLVRKSAGSVSCLYLDAEKTQLCIAKSCACSSHQRDGSHHLYSRRRTQPARALDRAREGRPCEGLAGRALSHRSWSLGRRWGGQPKAKSVQVWREATEIRVS